MNESGRFWSKVDRSGDCWLWTGGTLHYGYGGFWLEGKTLRAHRVAWELENGAVPDGLCVLHRCDVPACVKVSHLFLGTHKDNVADMYAKRRRRQDGEFNNSAKLMASDVRDIRLQKGQRQDKMAATYGVSEATVSCILSGKLWASI